MTVAATEHFCNRQLPPGECCNGKPRQFVRVLSWGGITDVEVEILGRTPKRVRIRFLSDSMKGRRGDVRLVAADAIHQPARREP